MLEETVLFYDRESDIYSEKRYPKVTENFTQYLFKRRRDIFLKFLGKILEERERGIPFSIMEVGCADGILFKQVEARFPNQFAKLVGMDISPKMVEVAKSRNTNDKATFYMRDTLPSEQYDIVVELGVHPFNLVGELEYASRHLKNGGRFFYSVVGVNSLQVYYKARNASHRKDYKLYKKYEEVFKKYYSVPASQAYGLFVPKLWAYPAIARIIQPILDGTFKYILPELFHEKIYLLKKKI